MDTCFFIPNDFYKFVILVRLFWLIGTQLHDACLCGCWSRGPQELSAVHFQSTRCKKNIIYWDQFMNFGWNDTWPWFATNCMASILALRWLQSITSRKLFSSPTEEPKARFNWASSRWRRCWGTGYAVLVQSENHLLIDWFILLTLFIVDNLFDMFCILKPILQTIDRMGGWRPCQQLLLQVLLRSLECRYSLQFASQLQVSLCATEWIIASFYPQ